MDLMHDIGGGLELGDQPNALSRPEGQGLNVALCIAVGVDVGYRTIGPRDFDVATTFLSPGRLPVCGRPASSAVHFNCLAHKTDSRRTKTKLAGKFPGLLAITLVERCRSG